MAWAENLKERRWGRAPQNKLAYRVKSNESLERAVQRVAKEQLGKALKEIDDKAPPEAVHQVRKRCKKIRALVRVVRHGFEDYSFENQWYRDLARQLSDHRDARSIPQSFDLILSSHSETEAVGSFPEVRESLETYLGEIEGEKKVLRQVVPLLKEGRERIDGWSLEECDEKLLRKGLQKAYRRGREAMAAAYKKPNTERFHQWRKRVKYHWYHMKFARSFHAPLEARASMAHGLADLLGEEHDLTVLREFFLEHSSPSQQRHVLFGLMDRQQLVLREKARGVGERLFLEKPKRFSKRVQGYWSCIQRFAPSPRSVGPRELNTPS